MAKAGLVLLGVFILAAAILPASANPASYGKQQIRDIEVAYASKMLVQDSSGSQKEAIFGVVGLWLPSQIGKIPDYFNSYESWRDTLLGSSSIFQEEPKPFEEVYTGEILREKYGKSAEQCQTDASKLGEICGHLASIEDFGQYLKSEYDNGKNMNMIETQRRRDKILLVYNETQLRDIYGQQKSLLEKGLWVRDIKLYFEIGGKRMLNDFARFNFYEGGGIRAIYAKFYELDDWEEEKDGGDFLPDAEALIVFDREGGIDIESSKIIIPPANQDSSALACNRAEQTTDSGTLKTLFCKSRCVQLGGKSLMHSGQEDEYDFFRIFWDSARERGLCAGDNRMFLALGSHQDCISNRIISVNDTANRFTTDMLKTKDIIHFGWNWGENDEFVWGEWNLANLEEATYSGCESGEKVLK